MPNNREISAALDRLAKGKPKPTDVEILRAALTEGRISVGGDMNQSILVYGDSNQVTLKVELSPEALQALFAKPTSPTQPGDLPAGSYLPFPRNGFFTGRVADMQKLSDALLPSPEGEGSGERSALINQALTGMGGLGKTQLAVEFAFRYGHRFQGVHWLDLREADTFEAQIALCGLKMALPDFPPSQPEQVELTLREWISHGPRLLILDNFEEVEAANDVFARLGHSSLRLLITSRRADWSPSLGLRRVPLDEFSPEESLTFLRNYIPEERESDAELARLAAHLGYLPLALELAGRYLEKLPRLSVRGYLAELEQALEHKSMQGWKAEQKSLTGHDLSLLQTFARSWEQVGSPTAQNLFVTLGYCAPNTPIPYEILETALGDEKAACDECLNDLLGLGLLKAGNSVHPLLAQFARRLDADNAHLKPFCEALADLANQTNHDEDRTGNYSLYTPLLPHLRAAAEHAEKAAPEPAGSLWNSIGYHIRDLADYAGAKAAYERALRIDEAAFGQDHPNVARDVNNLGLVLQDLGDLPGAKAAFERALKIDEAAFGQDHPEVATDVNNLGMVLKYLGDLPGAKAAFERALKIFEVVLGADHPNVATLVNNLGSLLKASGDLDGAKAAYERALRIDEAAFGQDHPNVARDVNNLGLVLKDLGDRAGAKVAYERALRILEKYFPPDHPHIKITKGNLESLRR